MFGASVGRSFLVVATVRLDCSDWAVCCGWGILEVCLSQESGVSWAVRTLA